MTGTSPSWLSDSWAIAAGNGSSVAAIVIRPAAPGTTSSIAATQSPIATASPPRLKTRAPTGSERLASSSVFATSSAYWKTVDPPKPISYGWPSTAAAIATVGPLVMPWSRPTP